MRVHKSELFSKFRIKSLDYDLLPIYYNVLRIKNDRDSTRKAILRYRLIKGRDCYYSQDFNYILTHSYLLYSTELPNPKLFRDLFEATRIQLVDTSKKQSISRYQKRLDIPESDIHYNLFDMNAYSKGDLLFNFDVRDYVVTLEYVGILRKIDKSDLSYESIRKQLLRLMDSQDVKVNCTCPDFYYRYSYVASQNHFKSGNLQTIPALVRNANNEGSVCKHILRFLNNKQWVRKYVIVLRLFLKMGI